MTPIEVCSSLKAAVGMGCFSRTINCHCEPYSGEATSNWE
jgi:hypothetical protein